ncbi:MAG: hypothetical protein AUI36_01135 [Cyanobacteria bacterium 13_1_40CM_2_61_4]|nr:MAG: hypothetical protein AUI36_01135 [Cyanobacteria bacterium 13_1_40CM_2_61_4]
MATITVGQQPKTTKQRRFRWQTLWLVLVAIYWVALLIGIVGDFFIFKGPTFLGFKENGNLWSWLQLLGAPVFLIALPLLLKGPRTQADQQAAAQQSQADGGMSDQQTQTDLKGEQDRQQEAALEAYQDHILQLVLDRNLRESQPGSDVREAARARTLAVLRRVGKNRKADVLLFLHDAGLIYKGKAIVDLRGTDLRWANLSDARLNGSELSGVDLSDANLNGTDLKWANLSDGRLSGADLTGADLTGVDLTGVDLSNANLNGAYLKGATFTLEQLSKAQSSNQGGISQLQNRVN